MRENREISASSEGGALDRTGKADADNPVMNDMEKSDEPVVPAKPPNNAGRPVAEVVEGRGSAKGNADQIAARRTQSRTHDATSGLDRVRRVARRDKEAKFTALLHHVDVDWIPDGHQREQPQRREELFERFRAVLQGLGAGVCDVRGGWAERKRRAVDGVDRLLA